jgi:hypothetical protein
MKEMKICGNCARWKVPDGGCTFRNDIDKGLIAQTDLACADFYPLRKTKKEKHTERVAGLAEEGWFESIYHDGKPRFLLLKDKEFSIVESVTCSGTVAYPREAKKTPYEPYGYFNGPVRGREDLFGRIINEFYKFIDVECIWKKVLSSCILLTYQQDKLLSTPYIYVYGDNESGKSTVLQLFKQLCYRPMFGVTIPSADIYGYLEDSEASGCILEDELQGIDRDTDKIKIYKAGYKQGAIVPRTILLRHDRIIKYYNTFCFKACASEQIPQIKGFRERFIEIPMVEGCPELEWADITEEDTERLHNLRDMLLKWRMLSKDWLLPKPELSLKGRLKELWKPILQITCDLPVYENLINFVEEQKNERLSNQQNTLEGHIVKVVTELHNKARMNPIPYVPFQTIWQELAYDLDARIDDKKPHQMDTSEFFQISKRLVGYRLREILSGQTKSVREGNSVVKAYAFDQDKLRRLAKKYGYELVTKLPMELTDRRTQPPETMKRNNGDNSEKSPEALSVSVTSVTRSKSIDNKTVLSVLALDPVAYGECPLCKKRDVSLVWRVLLIDGSCIDACCMDCGGRFVEQAQRLE